MTGAGHQAPSSSVCVEATRDASAAVMKPASGV